MFSDNGFSFKKSTQALNFFAKKENDTLDKMKALKLIYFSDRYHLRKYGRTLTNDEYFAMSFGPVASGTKDLIEMSNFLDNDEKLYVQSYLLPIPNTNNIKSIREIEMDELSASELETLNYIWEKLGSMSNFDLAELSHQYPEWKRYEERLKLGLVTRIRMDLSDFFDDPIGDLEKFYVLKPEEKEAKIYYLKELHKIESLWN